MAVEQRFPTQLLIVTPLGQIVSMSASRIIKGLVVLVAAAIPPNNAHRMPQISTELASDKWTNVTTFAIATTVVVGHGIAVREILDVIFPTCIVTTLANSTNVNRIHMKSSLRACVR